MRVLLSDTAPTSEPESPNDSIQSDDKTNSVRDALIRKYSYKQAMCIGAFSNTVKHFNLFEISLKLFFPKGL